MSWKTLHTLSPEHYSQARRDYIPLPVQARTYNSVVRWIQAAPASPLTSHRIHWALDDVFVGGKEINPAEYLQTFNSDDDSGLDGGVLADDPDAWEFNPYGVLGLAGNPCGLSGPDGGSAMVWMDAGEDGGGGGGGQEKSALVQMFTTNQMIVQAGYMLQFKVKAAIYCVY